MPSHHRPQSKQSPRQRSSRRSPQPPGHRSPLPCGPPRQLPDLSRRRSPTQISDAAARLLSAAHRLHPSAQRPRQPGRGQPRRPPTRAAILCGRNRQDADEKMAAISGRRHFKRQPQRSQLPPAPKPKPLSHHARNPHLPSGLVSFPGSRRLARAGEKAREGGEGRGAGDRGRGGEGGSARGTASLRVTTAGTATARHFPPQPP